MFIEFTDGYSILHTGKTKYPEAHINGKLKHVYLQGDIYSIISCSISINDQGIETLEVDVVRRITIKVHT